MGMMQWIILGGAIAAVLVVYLYTRRNNAPNPWHDMEGGDEELPAAPPESPPQADGKPRREVIVDPSVADEWSDFRPERQPDPAMADGSELDDISPARMKATVADEPASKEPPSPRQARQSQSTAQSADAAQPGEEKIVVLHIAGREQGIMQGEAIHRALQNCHLHFGDRDIYHRLAEQDGRQVSVFSVANMLKPGTLNPAEAAALQTRGLVMFMLLPGPVDGNRAFQDMLHTAQSLASELNGMVMDEKRLPLTRQAAQYQIDEIAELERRRRLAHA